MADRDGAPANGVPIVGGGGPAQPVVVAQIIMTPDGHFRISSSIGPKMSVLALLAVAADITQHNLVEGSAPAAAAPVPGGTSDEAKKV